MQPQEMTKIDVLLKEVHRLSAKVGIIIQRLDAMKERQTGGEPITEPASSLSATPASPNDIEMYGRPLRW